MNLRGRIRLEDTAQQGDGAFTPWGVVARQIAGSPADPHRAVPGRTDGHGGLSFLDVSSLNLAAESEGSAALFGQVA